MLKALALPALAAAAVFAIPASAADFIANFDDIAVSSGSYVNVTTADGFTVTPGYGSFIEIQNHAAGAPHSEPNLVELDSTANTAMSHAIDAGMYNLSFYYSPRPGVNYASNGINVFLGTSADPFASQIYGVSADGSALGDTLYTYQTTMFVSSTYNLLTFQAVGTSDSFGGYLDDIAVSGAVPEPASWAMMITGFGLVGGMARSRKVRAAIA